MTYRKAKCPRDRRATAGLPDEGRPQKRRSLPAGAPSMAGGALGQSFEHPGRRVDADALVGRPGDDEREAPPASNWHSLSRRAGWVRSKVVQSGGAA